MHGLRTIIVNNRVAELEALIAKLIVDNPDTTYEEACLAADLYNSVEGKSGDELKDEIRSGYPELSLVFDHIDNQNVAH